MCRAAALTISASFLLASRTRLASTSSRSVSDTQEGSTSMARQMVRRWSSPIVPASTACATSGSSGGSGGPVNWRRGRMRPATFMRRLISLGGTRNRAHKLSARAGTNSASSGGSAICAEHPIHQAAVGALLGFQALGHLHPKLVAHLLGGQCAHFVVGGVNLIHQFAKPLARRLSGDELPIPQRYRTHVPSTAAQRPPTRGPVDENRSVDNPCDRATPDSQMSVRNGRRTAALSAKLIARERER